MIKTRKLNAEGTAAFTQWLQAPNGDAPPASILDNDAMVEPFGDYEIDQSQQFNSRLEFGTYLNQQFTGADFGGLMSPDSDGVWTWLAGRCSVCIWR